ncbi:MULTISPECIES: RagB/SusD family nutrient uptake outer membrane protein [Olivibacter]|uniref:RagB/SusD family nutrient uptake outer membrane protein n=1 Tax=Olivibacter jilunii TaxID=985016 RepID=A0ABW6B8B9_9SPHI|nr:RagB/SusD family nutrient uptake outer membrane protein [Olivibacter sp. UJ_SKK_5.1]MDX3916778.1 RagB/SusD family nutrient uptake outer membrane protein [Pseudosphingobacterium sp.]
MKKKLIIIVVIMFAGFTSCKKFLTEENLSGITAENYYTNAAGYESLINSCYASLRGIYSPNPNLFEWGTDITTRGEIELVSGQANEVPAIQLNEYRSLTADNVPIDTFFTVAYRGIQRCNTAVNRAEGIPDLAENIKNRRLAEVRFLRAYFYYLLVENFGNVPIVQEEISSPVTHFAPNSEQEVYDFMIAELNAALPNLEANPASTEPGRATQGAARHLLALLYLTRGYKSFGEAADFERAAQLAEELIGSSYYALLPTFAEVFQPGNELNREIIFAVQYGAQPGYNGNGQNILFGWRYWREKGFDEVTGLRDYNRRISNFMPTQFLYTLYNTTKDSRYDATFLSRFYATKTDGAIQAGNLRYYFPYPDQPFTTADSIALKASNPNVEIIRLDKWKQAFNNVGGLEKFPMINKFYDPNAGLPYNNEFAYASTKDVFLFRLAETYLLAAEAYFKLGQLDKAAEKLNAIRQRAAKPGQNMNINAADVSIDFILDEKAREQAGEYKRWLDLKRTQRLARAFEYNILTKMANPGGLVDKYYLRPIPQSVIDRDTEGYPQNPGY